MTASIYPGTDRPPRKEFVLVSASNELDALVKSVELGSVVAEFVMEIDGVEIVSTITRGSAETLKFQAGDRVKAVIKAAEILIDEGGGNNSRSDNVGISRRRC